MSERSVFTPDSACTLGSVGGAEPEKRAPMTLSNGEGWRLAPGTLRRLFTEPRSVREVAERAPLPHGFLNALALAEEDGLVTSRGDKWVLTALGRKVTAEET